MFRAAWGWRLTQEKLVEFLVESPQLSGVNHAEQPASVIHFIIVISSG